jgi:hypothetical protein
MPRALILVVPRVLASALAPTAVAKRPSRHHHTKHAATAAVTKAEVIALIKQYAPGALAGAPGAHGSTGPTGPAGPTTAFSAGNGLVLNGTQFSLNPASTLYQDPLSSPQCPAYTFLYRITQAGTSSCDYGAVAFTGQGSVVPLSVTLGTVMSTTVWTTGSVLITGQVQLEGGPSATTPDVVQCVVYDEATGLDQVEGVLGTPIGGVNPYTDLAFTTVASSATPGSTFAVKCVVLTGSEPAWAEQATIAALPFS